MHWMLNEPQKWLTCSNLVITEKVTFPIKNRLENVNRLGCSSSPQIELIKKISPAMEVRVKFIPLL